MGSPISLLYAASAAYILIQTVNGYCQGLDSTQTVFCQQYDHDEKNCVDKEDKCRWVEGPRPDLAALADPSMIHMKQNALVNFDAYKSHISNPEFIKDLQSDDMMSLPIDLEMKYTTTVTLQLLRAFYYEYFEMYGKTKEFLHIDWYILAVGSFGRNELLPCSDLDILVLGIGPGLLNEEEYKAMKAKDKDDPRLKPSADADQFLNEMNDAIKAELKKATGHTFVHKAFELDKAVPRKFADSTDKILEPFLDVNEKTLWRLGGSMSPISFFADVQVIYERVDNTHTPFNTLLHHWIHKVPLHILNAMFESDLQKNLKEIQDERVELFPKTGMFKSKEQKKEAKVLKEKEIKPKYFFIRPYSLLTYWAYLLAYKFPKYPRYSREVYLMGTVDRMNKLAEWGYIPPEAAFWSSYYFHQANIWSLRGNLITEKSGKQTQISYAHGKGFVFGKHGKFIKSMLADDSEAIVGLTAFGEIFRHIYEDSRALEKEVHSKKTKRKSLSLSSPLDIVTSTIKVDEEEIAQQIATHSAESKPARREYGDRYDNYDDGGYNDDMDGYYHYGGGYKAKLSVYDDDSYYYDGARLVNYYGPKVKAKVHPKQRRRNHRNRYGRRGLMDYMNDRERADQV